MTARGIRETLLTADEGDTHPYQLNDAGLEASKPVRWPASFSTSTEVRREQVHALITNVTLTLVLAHVTASLFKARTSCGQCP